MRTHPGYFVDSLHGQTWYRCLSCQYDSFLRENIQQHAKTTHLPALWPELVDNHLQGRTIGLSLITWNTADASVKALAALTRECRLLAGLGVKSKVFWCDNGSEDDTVARLTELANSEGLVLTGITLNTTNTGQSAGRNAILRAVRATNCDFLLMVDGDIEIVPFSSFAFSEFLETSIDKYGCVGAYCRNCTDDATDPDLPVEFRVMSDMMADSQPATAWTNYGVFRREVFSTLLFDESGPFYGPGWGFEDDDYYLQMTVAGFQAVNTKWLRHLHRKRHSSLRLLDQSLAAKVYADRKAYLLSKWRDCWDPEVRRIIGLMENQTMPVVD